MQQTSMEEEEIYSFGIPSFSTTKSSQSKEITIHQLSKHPLANLKCKILGKSILHASQTASTQTFLCQNSHSLPNGTVFWAEEQWASITRKPGHKWHSFRGHSLLFSLLIRHESFSFLLESSGSSKEDDDLNVLLKVVTEAIWWELDGGSEEKFRIKLPNDIVNLQGQKVAGVMIDAVQKESGIVDAVVGIGVNLKDVDVESELFVGCGDERSISRLLEDLLLRIERTLYGEEKKCMK